MPNLLFALIGLATGGLINLLADDLPERRQPQRPHCPDCNHVYGPARWLAVGRLLLGSKCPDCGRPVRQRAIVVELGTALLFAFLPTVIQEPRTLIATAVYIAILLLVIVIDLEYRLILHVVTLPSTILAILASSLLPGHNYSILSALLGAALGFGFFFIAYWVGQLMFGPGALGFGDVTLSMTMGAMLGFDRILFTLILGILFGGAVSLALVIGRRYSLRSHIAYGPYLAIAGITMLLWGKQMVAWFLAL